MTPSAVRRSLTVLFILGVALSLRSPGFAEEATPPVGPLAVVKSSVARVLDIVQSWPAGSHERRARMVRVSRELFDFDEISRRALSQHWQRLSPGEQAEFVYLFTEVLEQAFIASVDGYTNETIAFLGEVVDGSRAEVRSRIIPKKGAAVSIDYRLHEDNSRWMVYDVRSEHVSLVASYRSQFNSVLRASSVADLLGRMRTDRLRHREPTTPMPLAPDPLAEAPFGHRGGVRSDIDIKDAQP